VKNYKNKETPKEGEKKRKYGAE